MVVIFALRRSIESAARELTFNVTVKPHDRHERGVDVFNILVDILARLGRCRRKKFLNVVRVDKMRLEPFQEATLER